MSEIKGQKEDEFMVQEAEKSHTTYSNLSKDSWTNINLVLSKFANLGITSANLNVGLAASQIVNNNLAKFQSSVSAASLGITLSKLNDGLAASQNIKNDWSRLHSIVSATSLGITPSHLNTGLAASQITKIDWSKFRLAASEVANLGTAASNLNAGLVAYQNTKIDWSEFQSVVSQASKLGAYQNAVSNSALFDGYSNLSRSLDAMNEFSQDIQDEITDLEETSLSNYSEEDIEFVFSSLEEWMTGSISYKSTLKRLKENTIAWLIVHGLLLSFIWHLAFIFAIVDDHQLQRDREVMENIQSYVETEVSAYKLYKKFFINSEQWTTSVPLGITRKDIQIREGRSRKSPVVASGLVGQKTIVFMFETKNNWRRVEMKIGEAYVQGWAPESTIVRLKTLNRN